MLAIADQFPEWKDFPRGLRVMLVDEDMEVIDDVRQKLEANGYVVTCYSKGLEALQALADRNNNHNSFHVVVVDASRSDSFDGFEIVAAAKHLTAIMMASTENMNLMMQGIAAGASEILQKPLSEERLKNIWQHVVRKALVTGHFAAPTTDIAADLEPLTSPSLTVCKDDNQSNVNVKQEEETRCTPHHDGKPDQDGVPGRFPADGGRVLVFREQEAENHDGSSYFDMDEKTFLCSTPPQLEQTYSRIPTCTDHEDNAELTAASPTPSHSQDFSVACMQRELNEIHECFDDCDSYLHMKSEVEDAVNNSAILNELFESQMSASKPENHSDNFLLGSSGDGQAGMGNGELSSTSKFCDDLEFDGMDDITVFSGDLLDDGNGDQSLSIGFDCFDDEDIPEADEEALLLAEVAKAENGMCNVSNQNVKKLNGSISKLVTDGSTSNNGCQPDADELYNRCKSDSEQSCNIKGSKSSSNGKKKMKVDWTPELHRRFVQAVEQLGVDKAIPSRILDLMGVKCLTRHNIASHLQKYRSHRKHVLAREVEVASWNQRRHMDHAWRPASGPKPPVVQAAPPPHPRPALAAAPPALHVWGHPPVEHAMHFWPAWPAPTACPVDAWGNPFFMPAQPILRVPLAPMPSVANIMPATCGKLANLHPPKETVVAAINEVLRNPYIPLPLGLKPPSLESVVSELHRQGVCMAPTPII